jgi:hypothetical protein
MQKALCFKCHHQHMNEYIKTTKHVSELLTVTDEAFIHLCIINYSATWKAQEKKEIKANKFRNPGKCHLLNLVL